MPGYKRKTPAERAAIDQRARNWPRPLSRHQRAALEALGRSTLSYGFAGFHLPFEVQWRSDVGQYHSSQTLLSLAQRGLCRISGSGKLRRARITAAGRRELAR